MKVDTRKKRRRRKNKSSSIQSSVASNFNQMSLWSDNPSLYQHHFISLLFRIMNGSYREIGNRFNLVFWKDFAKVFSDIVGVTFTSAEVREQCQIIKDKWISYRYEDGNSPFPNLEIQWLQDIFSDTPTPKVKIPSIPVHSGSYSRITKCRSIGSTRVSRSRDSLPYTTLEPTIDVHTIKSRLTAMFNSSTITSRKYQICLTSLKNKSYLWDNFLELNAQKRLEFIRSVPN